MRKIAVAALSLLAASSALAQEATPVQETPSDAAIRAWVEKHPEVIAHSLDVYLKRLQGEQEAAAAQQVMALAPEMLGAGDPPVLGNPEGKVEMVYFLDAACGYCRKMTPHIKALTEANPDLKIVQRWVAILGPASQQAALVAQVVHREYASDYQTFYDKLMSHTDALTPEVIDTVLFDVFGAARSDEIKVKATMGDSFDKAAETIKENMALVDKAKIEGTPFMMVANGGPQGVFRGYVPDQAIQAAVATARSSGGALAN